MRNYRRPARVDDQEAREAVAEFCLWLQEHSIRPNTEPVQGVPIGDVATHAMSLYQAGYKHGLKCQREAFEQLEDDFE